jgi:hypothetical protein
MSVFSSPCQFIGESEIHQTITSSTVSSPSPVTFLPSFSSLPSSSPPDPSTPALTYPSIASPASSNPIQCASEIPLLVAHRRRQLLHLLRASPARRHHRPRSTRYCLQSWPLVSFLPSGDQSNHTDFHEISGVPAAHTRPARRPDPPLLERCSR